VWIESFWKNTRQKDNCEDVGYCSQLWRWEPEVITYAELNDGNARVSDKEISNTTEQSFVFCDAAKGDFIVVNVAGKRSVPHYVAESLHLR